MLTDRDVAQKPQTAVNPEQTASLASWLLYAYVNPRAYFPPLADLDATTHLVTTAYPVRLPRSNRIANAEASGAAPGPVLGCAEAGQPVLGPAVGLSLVHLLASGRNRVRGAPSPLVYVDRVLT
jgi:hypothetical protein